MGKIGYKWINWPSTRIRWGLTTRKGCTDFNLSNQLEYNEQATLDGCPPDRFNENMSVRY